MTSNSGRSPFRDYYRLIASNRNFRLLWIAQIISEIGDWFFSVAIFSYLLERTGSAQSIAVAFAFQVLPQVLASPAAGVINDRVSRRKVLMFADWSRSLIILSMLLVTGAGLAWLLYVLLFLETVMWALFEPGRTAIIPNITSQDETPIANALSSATWAVNFMLGAALGGFAAAYLGRPSVFVLDSFSFVASALLIGRMSFTEPHLDGVPPLRIRDFFDFSPIAEGLRYVRQDARRSRTILVKAGAALIGTNWVILPILGTRVFPLHTPGIDPQEAGTIGMSVLLGSRGLGAFIGSFGSAAAARVSLTRIRHLILIGFCLAGLGYCALHVSMTLMLACLSVMIAHAGSSMTWVSSTTLLQQVTEDRFRGRVFSAEYAFAMIVLAAANYSASVLIDRGFSAQQVALYTGIAQLIPAALWAFTLRKDSLT